MGENIEGLILMLLKEGSNSDAVKVYQEETGLGHRQAKHAVARLASRNGIALRDAGYADVVLVLLVLAALVLGAVIH